MQLNTRRALSATRRKRSGGVAMRNRLAALAAVAAAGAILSCSNTGVPAIDSQQDRGAGNGQDQPGATLYPIRYGYRGGPYTSGGKPRPKTGPGEATPTAPM